MYTRVRARMLSHLQARKVQSKVATVINGDEIDVDAEIPDGTKSKTKSDISATAEAVGDVNRSSPEAAPAPERAAPEIQLEGKAQTSVNIDGTAEDMAPTAGAEGSDGLGKGASSIVEQPPKEVTVPKLELKK